MSSLTLSQSWLLLMLALILIASLLHAGYEGTRRWLRHHAAATRPTPVPGSRSSAEPYDHERQGL